MRTVRILVCDLAPSAGLVEPLVAVLESANMRVAIVQPPAAEPEPGLRSLVEGAGARAVYLILPNPPVASRLRELGDTAPCLPIFAVTAARDPALLLELLRLGFHDFLRPPLESCEVLPRLWRALSAPDPRQELRHSLKKKLALQRLIGRSPAFLAQSEKIPLLARCDVSVLICGETGTGKELFARAIHALSPRAKKPFVPINCGAIPTELLENEFFGHARGAFTGAAAARSGLVAEADGGTLFFDEIDSLPLAAQVKILRFLQDKTFRRLGSTRLATSDARVLAATNVELESAVERGEFRRDLYYRLNVVPIRLPPLRERREDIPLLTEHFLRRYNRQLGRQIDGFSDRMMAALVSQPWPGNIRELQHAVQRAVVLCERQRVIDCRADLMPDGGRTEAPAGRLSFKEAKARVVASFERGYVESMLATHSGNISRAARAASKDRRAFFELIRRHRIDVDHFRAAGA